MVKTACNSGDPGSVPGSARFPWRKEWQPTPVFLPGEFHGQRSLTGYSPRSRRKLDTTKRLTVIVHFNAVRDSKYYDKDMLISSKQI